MRAGAVRALTLHRPWDECILRFGKNVENRGYGTGYRGPLLVHAGLKYDRDALTDVRPLLTSDQLRRLTDSAAPVGYVGVVDVVGCHRGRDPFAGAAAASCSCGPWAQDDAYHWQLANPRPFRTVIPGPGAQGLFRPPTEVIDRARLLLDLR